MPSNLSPLGALPARFRRPRVLIVGCGDVGLRAATALGARRARGPRVLALTSSQDRRPQLRAHGVQPLIGNLDAPATLRRLAGLATHVLHLAPPAGDAAVWWRDFRTVALLRALGTRTPPDALVYGSTSGVYGDCGGAWVDETRAVAPATPRAVRRVDAEHAVRHFGRTSGTRSSILRIPGIYANDREGGTPRARLLRGTPVLAQADDVFTNHIQADDLARACVAALWRGRPQRVVHASDHTQLRMGDYMDFAADLYGLPRPPRIARAEAERTLPVTLLSFMGESRRLRNVRLERELRVRLLHPTIAEGLRVRV